MVWLQSVHVEDACGMQDGAVRMSSLATHNRKISEKKEIYLKREMRHVS